MADAFISGLAAAAALTGDELVEVSQLSSTITITATTISALASDNSYNDSANGFVAAGFAVGQRVRVSGFTGNVANNILVGVITALTAGKMTIGGADGNVIVDDAAGESVTIKRWTSRRTTAQAIADLAPGSAPPSINAQTGTSYTLDLTDADNIVQLTNAAAITLTIPPNASEAFPIGTAIEIHQGGAGAATVTPDTGAGVTLESRGSVFNTAGQGAVAVLRKISTNGWRLAGDIA